MFLHHHSGFQITIFLNSYYENDIALLFLCYIWMNWWKTIASRQARCLTIKFSEEFSEQQKLDLLYLSLTTIQCGQVLVVERLLISFSGKPLWKQRHRGGELSTFAWVIMNYRTQDPCTFRLTFISIDYHHTCRFRVKPKKPGTSHLWPLSPRILLDAG